MKRPTSWQLVFGMTLLVSWVRPVVAEQDGVQFFERRIRPVLVEQCYECHSPSAKELGGKLQLDSREAILRGGESGPALVAEKPDESLIVAALRRTSEVLEMPPDEPLPESVVQDFVKWVKIGAPDPRADRGAARESVKAVEATTATAVWSFQPITDPALPAVRNAEWPTDPIDHFVLARLESEGHTPTGDAPAEALVRRLYFDLTGLAPAIEEVQSFLAAYDRDKRKSVAQLVDRLLEAPQFGERWGRHWLDIARFGESNGNDGLGRNPTFPHAWRYRDYVIGAFNDDVPYDRFLKEQIAGDLLPATSAEQRNRQLVATGFLAIGAKPAVAMNQNFAMDVVDDQIDVVSTALMGLSVSCARCHDHKHDPIAARDYYALAGIFNSTETLWGKAGNVGLTAPATPLHALRDALEVSGSEGAGAGLLVFADDYGAAIDALKPAVHSRLDARPENVMIEQGVTFSAAEFAKVSEGRIRIDTPVSADNYSISFWFRNDLSNSARAITTYLFSHAADGDKAQIGDHLGIGGTHGKSRSGKLFLWNGTRQDESIVGSQEIPEGSWNHVVLVRSGTRLQLYLNGEPEIDGQLVAPAAENRQMFFAARNDHFAPLKGCLAELAVFDRALDSDQAQQLRAASGQPLGTPQPAWAMGVREKQIADCRVNIDGDSKQLGPLVPRGFLSASGLAENRSTIPKDSSGRLQLAEWLTRGDHPLTARVMANRIWMHLFGRAIVATPDDFGVYGARPSHPGLLDHLAQQLMEGGWSVKQLIRTIVLSRSYQLDSRCRDERLLTADPDNILIGRHSRRRLDAESLRDRILQASGNLDLQPAEGSAIAGIDILINWPPGEAKYLHKPSNHRSVYLCVLRNSPPSELAAFDFPDGIDVAGSRAVTTSPAHALFLLNSPFVVEQCRALAEGLLVDCNDEARVVAAYHRALQRDPSQGEMTRALKHVDELKDHLSEDASLRAWASLCQALLASSEFRYLD